MAAAISFGNLNSRTLVTVTVTGASATTAYTVQIVYPEGSTQSIPVKTDGGGGATVKFVPTHAGSYTANLVTTTSTAATATTSSSHSA